MLKSFQKSRAVGLLLGNILVLSACAGGMRGGPQQAHGDEPSLAEYREVMIDTATVEFDPRWKPMLVGSNLEIPPSEMEHVKRDIQRTFDEAFRKELLAKGDIRVVDRPRPGVVRITPKLVDVQLNAPAPTLRPGVTYVRSVGNVGLRLGFHDAVSGEQIMELRDSMRGRDMGYLRPASPQYNRAELSRIFEDWAQIVRQDLFMQP